MPVFLLMNLEHLYLDGNAINSISDSIVQMGRLRLLDLENNQFTSFPRELRRASSLEVVKVNGNPINFNNVNLSAFNFKIQRLQDHEDPNYIIERQIADADHYRRFSLESFLG